METFTHAEGNLDDEVFEKSKSQGSDTDVESGLDKIEGRLLNRRYFLIYISYRSFFFFFGEEHRNKFKVG